MLADLFIYAGYGLALMLAFGLLVIGFAIRDVLALRLRGGRVETVPCERLPAYVEPLCAQTERRLRDLGFEPFLCERQEEMLASDHAVRWARVYIHLDERVFASVAVAASGAGACFHAQRADHMGVSTSQRLVAAGEA